MAHHKSALKRIRTSEKARLVNRRHRMQMKELIKSVLTAENKKAAEPKFKETVSFLDKMVLKNLIHKNKASNQKSRLAKYVSQLS
jgi:small subunit ribosomal protein S20